MLNITYLLGAGASCNCLPMYSNFRQRFDDFYKFIKSFGGDTTKQIILIEELDELTKVIGNLNLEFRFHSTPDTIAKKYFHSYSGEKRLRILKEIVILFFLYEQTMNIIPSNDDSAQKKQTVDKRYDAFIASILKPKRNVAKLLSNIKVLTWNYDLQFEIAFLNYVQSDIVDVQKSTQSRPAIVKNDVAKMDRFSIVHLNGIAYAKPPSHGYEDYIGKTIENRYDTINYLLDTYVAMKQSKVIGGEELLSFAWEKSNEDFTPMKNHYILKYATEIAEQTQVLVINGYSFPNFNRFIDASLFEKMTDLETVYIQSPQADEIIKIINEIKPSKDFQVENVGYWNQFYVPDWTKLSRDEQTTPMPIKVI